MEKKIAKKTYEVLKVMTFALRANVITGRQLRNPFVGWVESCVWQEWLVIRVSMWVGRVFSGQNASYFSKRVSDV